MDPAPSNRTKVILCQIIRRKITDNCNII